MEIAPGKMEYFFLRDMCCAVWTQAIATFPESRFHVMRAAVQNKVSGIRSVCVPVERVGPIHKVKHERQMEVVVLIGCSTMQAAAQT